MSRCRYIKTANSEKKLKFDFREVWCFFFSPSPPPSYTKRKFEQIFCVESIIFKWLPPVPHKNARGQATHKSVQLTAASGIPTFEREENKIIKTLNNNWPNTLYITDYRHTLTCYLHFNTGTGTHSPTLGLDPLARHRPAGAPFTRGQPPPTPPNSSQSRLREPAAYFHRFTTYFSYSESREAGKALVEGRGWPWQGGTQGPWGEGGRRPHAPREGHERREGPRSPRSPHRSSPPQNPTRPTPAPSPAPSRFPPRGAGAGPAAWPALPYCRGAQALRSRKAAAEGAAAGRRGARSGWPGCRPGCRPCAQVSAGAGAALLLPAAGILSRARGRAVVPVGPGQHGARACSGAASPPRVWWP